MSIVIFTDEELPPAPDGPRPRVIVVVPWFVERLIERLVRLLTGGA